MNAKHFLYLLAACVLFCFLYLPAQLYFLSDDWDSVYHSLRFDAILHSYRPLADASLYLDYSIWQLNATGFHATNFILHFACVFCVYFFANNIFGLQNKNTSLSALPLASSVLFLFYPFHSEALFWIVGRGAILCTLFSLLCFLFFMKKEESIWFYWLSLLCFGFALLSYEEAWIVPLAIVVLAFTNKQRKRRITFLFIAGFLFVFLLYFLGRLFFTNDVIGTPYGSARMIDFSFLRWCKNTFALIARSVVLPLQSSKEFVVICSIVTVFFIAVLFFIRKKINVVMVVSSVCFLISLLPVISLGIDTHDTESERFLYFPSLFFTLFFIQTFTFLIRKKWWLFIFVFVAEIFFLRQSYDSFVVSSRVSKTTLSACSKMNKLDTIFCKKLPGQYKGAFIFRNGFESAVKLMMRDSASRVIILSRSETFHPNKNYIAEFSNSSFNNNKNNIIMEWQEDKVILKK